MVLLFQVARESEAVAWMFSAPESAPSQWNAKSSKTAAQFAGMDGTLMLCLKAVTCQFRRLRVLIGLEIASSPSWLMSSIGIPPGGRSSLYMVCQAPGGKYSNMFRAAI